MTKTIFSALPEEINSQLQQQARAQWHNYGLLSRAEHWRWTPLDILRDIPRQTEAADYQFSMDNRIREDFGVDITADTRLLGLKDGVFAALNVAQLSDALLIDVPESAVIDELTALNIDMFTARLQFSRIHIRLGKNSRSAFWLDFNAAERAAQLPVVSIDAATGAQTDVALWFNGNRETAQLMQVLVTQAEASTVLINAVEAGGALSRLDVEAQLNGDKAHFAFGGVQCLQDTQVGDYHICVQHHGEHGTSHQVVRGALDGESFGIFDGMIYVAHGAQKTDAEQDCRYIVLSDQAKSHSVPRLEIYADDVKCAHGTTTGCLDDEALFYLQSRGISREDARKMLILSFLYESVIIEHDTLKEAVEQGITRLWLGEAEQSDAC